MTTNVILEYLFGMFCTSFTVANLLTCGTSSNHIFQTGLALEYDTHLRSIFCSLQDLLEVIAQNCLQIATDEYGCRMLQQFLDIGCNVVKQRLTQEIIANALRLCVDSFG